ncbi:hypothetical protein LLY41_02615 [Cytobacillus firmus]|uniref:hypothetical protein n=1 Tax=Cytobacillus firmus TaxID=1399 RepID=UPI00218C3C43|nr:hypothetical protein [Cytobacillus firmus]URM33394.1 hypothetical protein LLY41_02615 [Cytobacillus firmus]
MKKLLLASVLALGVAAAGSSFNAEAGIPSEHSPAKSVELAGIPSEHSPSFSVMGIPSEH